MNWSSTPADFFRTAPPAGAGVAAARRVQPILISKVNTVLQFVLVGSCVSARVLGWPPPGVTDAVTAATVTTTVFSGLEYFRLYRAGKLM